MRAWTNCWRSSADLYSAFSRRSPELHGPGDPVREHHVELAGEPLDLLAEPLANRVQHAPVSRAAGARDPDPGEPPPSVPAR